MKGKVLSSIGLMLLWALCVTTAMSLAKAVTPSLSNTVLLFFRSLFGFFFVVPFATKGGRQGLKTKRPLLHALRACLICSAMACTYYAYRHLPMATASGIGLSGPLFTSVLSFFILSEKITAKKWLAILVGYLGVLIILRPTSFSLESAVYVLLLANVFASCSIITTKKLASTEPTIVTVFYTAMTTTVLSAMIALGTWQLPSSKDLLLLVFIGLAGAASQFFYAEALKRGNPSFLSTFEYTRLLFAVSSGYLFFGEVPGIWVAVGALVIITANLFLSKQEIALTKKIRGNYV